MKSPSDLTSRFEFCVGACGPVYLTLLLLAGVVSIVLILVLIKRGRWPEAASALLMIIPLPLFVGLYAAVSTLSSSFYTLSLTDAGFPANEYGRIVCRALVQVWLGCWASLLSFVIVAVGLTRWARDSAD